MDGYICLFEAVAQFDGAVEDGFVCRAVGVNRVVAEALKLVDGARFCRRGGFGFRALDDGERLRVDGVKEVFGFHRVRLAEEAVVVADFAVERVFGADPVDDAVGFVAFGVFAEGVRVVVTTQFGDVAVRVFDDFVAGDDVAAAQAHRLAGGEAFPFFRRVFADVVALDVEGVAEGDAAAALAFVLRVVGELVVFFVVIRQAGDGDFERADDGHAARGVFVQVVADGAFEVFDGDGAVGFADADFAAEFAQRARRDAAAAHAGDGWHARVVPAVDVFFGHELDEAAFGEDGVFEREAGEFDLLRVAGGFKDVQYPVVERAVVFEFEGAERVGDVFQHVRQAVGVVVHGIDFP